MIKRRKLFCGATLSVSTWREPSPSPACACIYLCMCKMTSRCTSLHVRVSLTTYASCIGE
jgi:hypothetical protein